MVGTPRKRSPRSKGKRDALRSSDGPRRAQAITEALLRWYDVYHRDLPWRRQANAYSTWVSEIMLQQTQVAAVVPYFERWMNRFPTIGALANAEENAVLSTWQGLGYYSRARNLQRSARILRDELASTIPSDPKLLRQLPGIGRYTAGAIASIAFDLPEPAVDGNVMRVLTRLEALRGDPRVEPLCSQLWKIAADWVHRASPRRFNQALMELGALVCIPDKPHCDQCPVLEHCHAQRLALTDQLPELPKRPKPEARRVVVLLVERKGRWLVVKQPETAQHWAGLFVFPYTELRLGEAERVAAQRMLNRLDAKASLTDTTPPVKFTYPITRFRFQAAAYRAGGVAVKQATNLGATFASAEELVELAMPAPHRRLLGTLR